MLLVELRVALSEVGLGAALFDCPWLCSSARGGARVYGLLPAGYATALLAIAKFGMKSEDQCLSPKLRPSVLCWCVLTRGARGLSVAAPELHFRPEILFLPSREYTFVPRSYFYLDLIFTGLLLLFWFGYRRVVIEAAFN